MNKLERRVDMFGAIVILAVFAVSLLGLPIWTVDVIGSRAIPSIVSASLLTLFSGYISPLKKTNIGPVGVLWLAAFIMTYLIL